MRYLQVEKEARDEGCFDARVCRCELASISYLHICFDDAHFREDRDITVAQALERDVNLGDLSW